MARTQNSPHVTAVFFASMAFVFLNFSLPIYAADLGVGAVGIGAMFAIYTGTMLCVRTLVGGFIYDYWLQEMAFMVNGVLLLTRSLLAWVWFKPKSAPVAPSLQDAS
jgi:hypothetical protein